MTLFWYILFQELNAHAGIPLLRKLVERFHDKVKIMPGGGINTSNLKQILVETRVQEFHASARHVKESRMIFKNEKCKMGTDSNEYSLLITSVDKVKALVDIYAANKNNS
jgi:copper homeostasis protein